MIAAHTYPIPGSAELRRAAIVATPAWLERCIRKAGSGSSGPAIPPDAVTRTAGRASAFVADELDALFVCEPSAQRQGPLQVLRGAVRFPTELLRASCVDIPSRDAFAVEAFPDDVYNLTPASFADFDPSLHELGIEWGAAKAWLHLRERAQR